MKKILSILFVTINFICSYAQNSYIIEGKIINNTETSTWTGINIPRNEPTKFIFRNNSITSVNREGYLLQAGDENPSLRDNNLDNQEIIGNILIWKGPNDPTIITHGILTGYNINSIVKYNKLINVPYGIIFKSGTDEGKNMTFTSGGCAYNICKNGKFAVRMKGINAVKVFNNTFYSDNITSQYLLLITSNQDRAIPAPSMGSKIFNNIFYTTMKIPMISIESGSLVDFESDYNVFWCTSGEPIFAIDGNTYTWQQWTALGYDLHSKIINPRFNNTQDFIPEDRLDYGVDLGKEWENGLSVNANWIAGKSPTTANQNGVWQVGAIIRESDEKSEEDNSESFQIFPNPSNGKFQLRINNIQEGGVMVEIKNILGQILLQKMVSESITEWSVIKYAGSILFITLRGINIHATKRIIINYSLD